jgi:hypothetical protein
MPSVSSQGSEAQENIWDEIDRRFRRTMQLAENAYQTNYVINLIIVIIGIIFLGSSIYFSYVRGLDASTLTYAGIGIADFVALFLVNPQRRIEQLIGDLDQIEVIFRTWKDQTSLIDDIVWDEHGHTVLTTFEQINKYNTEYGRISEEALNAIERYIGAENPPQAAGSSKGQT